MSGRRPEDVWGSGLEEGERRLQRSVAGLAATGFAGGIEIFFGIMVMAVTTAAFTRPLGASAAHVLGSIAFGIGFVHLTIGRAELFTENFLIPVSAVYAGRGTVRRLLSMWVVTLAFNLVGLTLFAAIMSVDGVLSTESLRAAGALADTYGQRAWLPALMSGVAAGTVMTLFTWVVAAAEDTAARVLLGLLIGFVLGVPALNHAVVSFGEIVFGLLAGTSVSGPGDLARNLGLAIVGNAVGGIGLVFATRLTQVRGEPGADTR